MLLLTKSFFLKYKQKLFPSVFLNVLLYLQPIGELYFQHSEVTVCCKQLCFVGFAISGFKLRILRIQQGRLFNFENTYSLCRFTSMVSKWHHRSLHMVRCDTLSWSNNTNLQWTSNLCCRCCISYNCSIRRKGKQDCQTTLLKAVSYKVLRLSYWPSNGLMLS